MTLPRINLFRDYARRRWGEWVGKVMLCTGVTCPNRAAGGCAYCAPESYRPYYLNPDDPLELQLKLGKGYLERLAARLFLAGFQTETATAGDWELLGGKLQMVLNDPHCQGLIISTRPDYLSEEMLDQLEILTGAYAEKFVLIELGLQSARPDSLVKLNRNHSLEDFSLAAARVRARRRFELGAHLILGIPGETLADMRHSIQFACVHGVGHLKLHHLQIVRGAPYAAQFERAPWPLPDADEYLDWLCALLPEVPYPVVLHRLWNTSRPDQVIAPRWNLEPNLLYARLFDLLEERDLRQGGAVEHLHHECV